MQSRRKCFKDGDGKFDNGECTNIGFDIASTQYDVTHVRMGGSWRMPNIEQIEELIDNCTHTWTQQNGVNGILVTGKNGGQIFLPAAGSRQDDNLYDVGSYSHYWSSSLNPYYTDFDACSLGFDSGDWWLGNCDFNEGLPVRAVCP